MHRTMRRSRLTVTLLGVGLLALGLAVLVNPIGAMEDGVSMVGWILVILGALTLLSAVMQGGRTAQRQWADLAVATLEIVPGIVMVAAPSALSYIIWAVMGVFVLFTGVHAIVDARSVGPRIAGGVVVGLGVAVIAASTLGPIFGMLLACLVLMVDGVIQLVIGLRMGERARH